MILPLRKSTHEFDKRGTHTVLQVRLAMYLMQILLPLAFTQWRHEPWTLWRILARDYLRTGTRRIYRTFRFALQDDVLKKCPAITAPTLIVRGGYDTIAPHDGLRSLQE